MLRAQCFSYLPLRRLVVSTDTEEIENSTPQSPAYEQTAFYCTSHVLLAFTTSWVGIHAIYVRFVWERNTHSQLLRG